MASGAGAQTLTGLGMSELGIAAQSIGTFLNARKASNVRNNPLVFSPGGDPRTDPLLSNLSLQAMLNLGSLNPSSIESLLTQSSPLNQARTTFLNTEPIKASGIRNLDSQISQLLSSTEFSGSGGLPQNLTRSANKYGSGLLLRMAGSVGMSVEDLLKAEYDFQQQAPQLKAGLEKMVADVQSSQGLARDLQLSSLQGLADPANSFESVREAELERLRRDINEFADKRRQDSLRQANLLDTNPGRELGEMERGRLNALMDSDLDAIGRALGIVSGEQALGINNLNTAQAFLNNPISTASNLAAVRTGAASSSPFALPNPTIPISPVGSAAIASGLGYQQLGGSLLGSSGGGIGDLGSMFGQTGGTAPGTGGAP